MVFQNTLAARRKIFFLPLLTRLILKRWAGQRRSSLQLAKWPCSRLFFQLILPSQWFAFNYQWGFVKESSQLWYVFGAIEIQKKMCWLSWEKLTKQKEWKALASKISRLSTTNSLENSISKPMIFYGVLSDIKYLSSRPAQTFYRPRGKTKKVTLNMWNCNVDIVA